MISVQMAKQDGIEVGEVRAALSEAPRGAAADVDEHARSAVQPYQITSRGPVPVQLRAAGAQYLYLNAQGRAALVHGIV